MVASDVGSIEGLVRKTGVIVPNLGCLLLVFGDSASYTY